jgi:hypothetical protein
VIGYSCVTTYIGFQAQHAMAPKPCVTAVPAAALLIAALAACAALPLASAQAFAASSAGAGGAQVSSCCYVCRQQFTCLQSPAHRSWN